MTEKKQSAFYPGKVWLDNNEKSIQAHGGCVIYINGTYYWYGEDKGGITISGEHVGCGHRVDVIGIHCYSSIDLYNWKDEGLVLCAVEDNPEHDLHVSRVVERPKVVYNNKTNQYVMWLHIDKSDYCYARTGVAISSSPTGPFEYRGSFQPNEHDSRDFTIFKDSDNKTYLFHSSEWNKTLYINELTENYLNVTNQYSRNFVEQSRESPAVFKYENYYYIITSGCTGWEPNAAQYAISQSIVGPWSVIGNPCVGEKADKTFFAQSTYVLPVEGMKGAFIMMLDLWTPDDLGNSRYVWLPIKIAGEKIQIEWIEKWDLSIFHSL